MTKRTLASPTMMSLVVPSQIRRWLPYIRSRQDWSVRDASKKASVSSSTFSRVENGGKMDVETYVALSMFIILWWYR